MAAAVEVVFRAVDQITGPLKKFTGELQTFKGALGASVAGISVAAVFRKFIDEASAAEQSLVRFNRVFTAFGEQAGQTRTEMERFASATQTATRFSDDAVRNMQTQLLRFTSIGGENFKKARTAILDLSEAMGTDLETTAFTLGRALEDPVRGMNSLRRAGVILSEKQQDLIKKLVETGQIARAQGIILDQVAKIYGGSATDAAGTFSGALAQLNNKFGDLFENQALIDSLRATINSLIKALDSDLVKGSINLIAKAFEGWGLIIGEVTEKFDRLLTLLRIKPISEIEKLFDEQAEAVKRYTKTLEELERVKKFNVGSETTAKNVAVLEKRAEEERQAVLDITRRVAVAKKNETGGRRGVKAREAAGAKAAEEDAAAPLKPLTDGLEAVVSKAKRTVFNSFVEETRTSIQQAADSANELRGKLEIAFDAGIVDAKEFNKRLDDIYDNAGLEVKVESSVKKVIEPLNELTVAQKRAIENVQDAFVDMFSNIDKGVKGMVAGFLQAFKQILANALALDLAKALNISGRLSGGSSGGSVAGSVLGSIFRLFGGKAGGGQFSGFSVVGEEGPELIYSAGTARVASNRAMSGMMGGAKINFSPKNEIIIQGNADEKSRAELIAFIEAKDAKNQRELQRMLERNGMRMLR